LLDITGCYSLHITVHDFFQNQNFQATINCKIYSPEALNPLLFSNWVNPKFYFDVEIVISCFW